MTITATSVARVTPGSTPDNTSTTASFTPPVGAMLVVQASFDNTNTTAVTISDSQSGSWTQVRSDGSADAPTGGNIITVIGYRLVVTSAAMTVTVASTGAYFHSLKLDYFTAAGALSIGATGHGGSATNNLTASAFTSTAASSMLVAAAGTLLATGTPTSSDLTSSAFYNAGLDDLAIISGYKTLAGVGAQTFNVNCTGSLNGWHWAAIEVVEASVATPPRRPYQSGAAAAGAEVTQRLRAGGRTWVSRNRTPETTDATIAATFGITAAATRTTLADATVGAAFGISASATVTSRLFTGERLEIEFTAGTWTDVTADMQMPLQIHQGRPTPYDEIRAGMLEVRLQNVDGRYLASNPLSPYFPNVAKGKRIRWLLTKGTASYARFRGWIQAWTPSFPGGDLVSGVVDIEAVDGLGLLEQRKLRSNFTEIALWRAADEGVSADVWEAVGQTSGLEARLTNYSPDAGKGTPSSVFSGGLPTLTFGTDNDGSFGDVVSCSQGESCGTVVRFQPNPLQISLHLKVPSSLLAAGQWYCSSFANSAATTYYGHLALEQNVTANGLSLRSPDGTTVITFIGNVPYGQWIKVTAFSRVDNPARSDWYIDRADGAATGAGNVNFDIRQVQAVEFPAGLGSYPAVSWGGAFGVGTRTIVTYTESFAAVANGTLGDRLAYLMAVVATQLPLTLGVLGVAYADTVATGTWSGRSAADVMREMARTSGGLVWARSSDSVVMPMMSDVCYPGTPLITVDLDGDCIGPPTLVDESVTRPTRVDVEWPGGTEVVIDAVAEADGINRSTQVTTVAATSAAARTVGETLLARSGGGLRFSRLVLDLNGGVNDHVPDLFSRGDGGLREGLHPSQRIRISTPPSYFGVSHMDAFVEGWTETYGANNEVTITLDLSAANDPIQPPIRQVGTDGQSSAVRAALHQRRAATGRTTIVRNR